MKKNETAAGLLLIGSLLLSIAAVLLTVRSDAGLYDKIVRLHILAASDSEEDQARKLRVRDALLPLTASLTESCETREEAEAALRDGAPLLERRAEEILREEGCNDPVTVAIGLENYPTRTYGDLRLPAGRYSSVRVRIGEAEGQNWWCVLFPPLCVGAAREPAEELISVGLTPGQVRVLTDPESPRFVLRFKLLEVFGSLFSR